MGSMAGRNFFK